MSNLSVGSQKRDTYLYKTRINSDKRGILSSLADNSAIYRRPRPTPRFFTNYLPHMVDAESRNTHTVNSDVSKHSKKDSPSLFLPAKEAKKLGLLLIARRTKKIKASGDCKT
jgi:hypothetical protein